MTVLRKPDANGILRMKVKLYLLKFLHFSLNLLGIIHQLWDYFQVKEDILSVLPEQPKKFNLNREEYVTMRRKMTTVS